LCFEYSDLSANYPTHCMLIPTVNYAVKTNTAPAELAKLVNLVECLQSILALDKVNTYSSLPLYYVFYFCAMRILML